MFPRDFYEIVHILGIAMLFAAMGGVAVHAANGGTKNSSQTRTMLAIMHGLGALLILTGGFGMAARMGMMGNSFPGWLWVKIGIWALVAGVTMLPYKNPALARPFFIVLPLLAGLAAYMAVYKPIT